MTAHALAFVSFFIVVGPLSSAVRIVDRDAKAVSGAEVIVTFGRASQPSALPPPEINGTSDRNGNLPFGIPAIQGTTLIIDHPAFAPEALDASERADGGDIRLDRGQSWRGRVVTRSDAGESLDGEICAYGDIGGTGAITTGHRWRRCANVERGSFQIEGLPRGPVSIDLQIAGYLPRVESVDPFKTTTLRIERGLVLRGIVRDGRELPLAGAMVSAGRSRATSDKEGRFFIALESLPAEVEVRMRGFRPWEASIKRLEEVPVRLDPASTISGVLLTADGGPLRDVTVEIVRTRADGGHSTFWKPVEIGKEGEFVIDVPDAGRYAIGLRARGYRQAHFSDLEIGYAVALPLGLISLQRGGGIHATVIDGTNGKGAAGALIEVVPAGALLLQLVGQYRRPVFISGEDGQFAAAGYEIGRYLVSIHSGEFAAVHRLVDVERDEIVDLGTITLDRGVDLRGTVVASDPDAVRSVPVRLFDPGREVLVPLATTTTDEKGRFSFPRVSRDRYRIEVGAKRLLSAQEIVVRGTEPAQELTLHAGGVQIRGHVTRSGIPVPSGSLRLVSELDPARRSGKIVMNRGGESLVWGLERASLPASVDGNGSFVFNGAPVGLARLWYAGPSGETVSRSVVLSDEPEQQIDVDLSGHLLEGRLIDGATGAGVSGTIRLFDADGRALTEITAAPDGTFRVAGLDGGAYLIDAEARGYVPAASKEVLVGNEMPPLVLEIRPGEPGKVSVTLTRADGTGVNGIPVTLFDVRGALAKSLPTNDSGRRAFDDMAPGKYIGGWSDPLAGAGCSSAVEIDASHTPALSATLERGASVVLRCSDHQCAGAPIGLLEVYSGDGLEMSPLLSGITPAIRLSADGEVTIGRLAPGRYSVRLWVADRQWRKDVTVGSHDLTVAFE